VLSRTLKLFLLTTLALAVGGTRPASSAPGPGPYFPPNNPGINCAGPSFSTSDYIVGTYYFYWYNVGTLEHIIAVNPDHSFRDGCTEHADYVIGSSVGAIPPYSYANRPVPSYSSPPMFSYADQSWHIRELQRMVAAGIDLVMPVYWGRPDRDDWSNQGLSALDGAMGTLESQGQPVPKIGMFYDTTTLNDPRYVPQVQTDLSTQAGKDQFYGTIRDFYSRVAPWRWARFNGAVLVWLYSSGFPANISAAVYQDAQARFARDFQGNTLFFVGDPGWGGKGFTTSFVYGWGAAAFGPQILDSYVAEIGPGFNNSAVALPGYPHNMVVPRQNPNGSFYYLDSWERVHTITPVRHVVALETWNEWHEGTDVAPSYEYGNTYYNWTAQHAVRHHFGRYWVQQAYLYLLGRAVDPSGFSTWTSAFDNAGPAAVRDALVNSAEARTTGPYASNGSYVTFLYNRYLHRAPDPGGYQTFVNALNSGASRPSVRDTLLNSAEAQQDVPNANFVTECYHQFLNREPDPGGFNTYMNALANGVPRSQVRDYFVGSIEFRYRDLSSLTAVGQRSIFDFAGWPPQ
jgi:hypothetical protein